MTASPSAYLCSYPKSGRTWMRFALVNLLNQIYELKDDFDLENMFGLIPNRDGEGLTQPTKTPDNYRYHDRPEVPFIVMSHLRWEPSFAEVPTVFLVRGPGDAVVSRFHHMSRHANHFGGTLADFVHDTRWGLPDLLGYLESWEPHLNDANVTVVTYEDLKTEPLPAFGRLVRGLGLAAPKEELAEALEAASIDRMRAVEAQSGVGQPQPYDFKDPNARRVRKAKVGNWRDEMDEDTVSFLRTEIDSSAAARKLLSRLDLIPAQL